MRVLVTGGAGFIGQRVVRRLLEHGHTVRVLDALVPPRNGGGALRGLCTVYPRQLTLVVGDVRDKQHVVRELMQAQGLVHLAAVTSVGTAAAQPKMAWQVNAHATGQLMEIARRMMLHRVVYVSSGAVYGDAPCGPLHEREPVRPTSVYAATKLAGEWACRVEREAHDLPVTVLRLFNVYGPGGIASVIPLTMATLRLFNVYGPGGMTGLIPLTMARLLPGEPPVIYGTGEATRDFLYVDDAVEAIMAVLHGTEAIGEVLNVGTGRCYTVKQTVEAVGVAVGRQIDPVYIPARPGDIPYSMAGVDRIKEVLGWQATVALEEGLSRTAAWMKQREGELSAWPSSGV